GASVDFLRSVGVSYFVNLRSNKQIEFIQNMIPNLIPTENIEYFTAKEVCKRLLDKIYSI
ncbi:hypothetical protein, partial [Dysgonomonas sp. HGC4]